MQHVFGNHRLEVFRDVLAATPTSLAGPFEFPLAVGTPWQLMLTNSVGLG